MPTLVGVFDEHTLTIVCEVRFPHLTYVWKENRQPVDRVTYATREDGLSTLGFFSEDKLELTLTLTTPDLALLTTATVSALRDRLLSQLTQSDFNDWLGSFSRRECVYEPRHPTRGILPQFLTEISLQRCMVEGRRVFLTGLDSQGSEIPIIYLTDLLPWAVKFQQRLGAERLTGQEAWQLWLD
jgi:hypothetical protein